jgi:hypothetical protein
LAIWEFLGSENKQEGEKGMKATGLLFCASIADCSCRRQDITKPHWHKVYESCFGVPGEKEKTFIDWDNPIENGEEKKS